MHEVNRILKYPNEWKKVYCRDWCENNEKIWLTLSNKNAICEIDKNSGKVDVLGSFPNNELYEDRLSYSVCKVDNLVIFCPLASKDIAIYDTKEMKLEFIKIPPVDKYDIQYREDSKFFNSFAFERNVYFSGLRYPGIIKLNLDSKQICCIDEWVNRIEKYACREGVRITEGHAILGKEAILPLGNCNGVLRINLVSGNCTYKDMKVFFGGIQGLVQYKNIICLTGRSNANNFFLIWDSVTDLIKRVKLPVQDEFSAPLLLNDTFVILGKKKGRGFVYSIKTEELVEITEHISEYGRILAAKQRNGFLYFFAEKGGGLYKFDPMNNSVSCKTIFIEDDIYLEDSWISFCNHQLKKATTETIDEDVFGVRDYIDFLGQKEQ